MKILVPIDSIGELDELVSDGADEFYGGFIPYEWFRNYGIEDSINRRNFSDAQIKSESELSEIIKKAHQFKKPFYLVLNQRFYLDKQYPMLYNLLKKAKEMDIDGLIIADLGLILFCQKERKDIPLILSTLGQVMNSQSAQFYYKRGIKRIVLSRDLSLSEINKIVKVNPSIAFEIFILIGKCFNLEGFCTYEHYNQKRVWPCNQEYQIEHYGTTTHQNTSVKKHLAIWSKIKRTDACGLCALPQLKKIGIKGLKIVGRGASLERKRKAVAAVKSLLDYSNRNSGSLPNKKYYSIAKKTFKDLFGYDCESYNCYFPELYEPRPS